MKTTRITLILLCLWSLNGYSQEMKTNSLTLNWGVGNLQRQDVNFSPFIHNSWSGLNAAFAYEHTGKQYHRVYTRFGSYKSMLGDSYNFYSTIEGSDVETLPNTYFILDLNYALGFNAISNEKVQLLIGGQVRNLLNVGDYNYGNAGSGYYNFAFGLDLWSKLSYTLNSKHQVGTEISLPVGSWVARSPYLGQDDQNYKDVAKNKVFNSIGNFIKGGELQSWGGFQRIDFQLNYAYTLNEKWNLKAAYCLNMNFSKTPQSYTSIENVLMIGAQLTL